MLISLVIDWLHLEYFTNIFYHSVLSLSIQRINSKKKSLTKRPPAPGKPKLKPKPTPSLPRSKTIYPYDATDVDELSFQPDEIIEIVKEGKSRKHLRDPFTSRHPYAV